MKLFLCLGLALAASLAETCMADEGQDDIAALNEQIKLKGPYEALNDYLVEQRLSGSFKHNKDVAMELLSEPKFDELGREFKEMVELLGSLDESYEKICDGPNLENLRKLVAKVNQHNKGMVPRGRLYELVAALTHRAYLKCLNALQDEWSEIGLGVMLMGEPDRQALQTLEIELDFVDLIKYDHNPRPGNERSIVHGLRCALEHSPRQLPPNGSLEVVAQVRSLMDNYLLGACAKMRSRVSAIGQQTIDKYLDLITAAILMESYVLGGDDDVNTFQPLRVKGVNSMVACNKLLDEPGKSNLLARKIAGAAQLERQGPLRPPVCKVGQLERSS